MLNRSDLVDPQERAMASIIFLQFLDVHVHTMMCILPSFVLANARLAERWIVHVISKLYNESPLCVLHNNAEGLTRRPWGP